METFIRKSSLNPFDDIWISGTEPYPCLAILINGNETCVSYFPNEDGDMWQAVGEYEENKETVSYHLKERLNVPTNFLTS